MVLAVVPKPTYVLKAKDGCYLMHGPDGEVLPGQQDVNIFQSVDNYSTVDITFRIDDENIHVE